MSLERMRHACLADVHLVSDDQPDRLRVDEHASGSPAVWLHYDNTSIGWILVDIGERDWSRLAYQFGHELGHVAANSWRPDAKPAAPCQWLEEAMVEAFSLRGLGLLADDWSRKPPFADDSGFGAAVAVYRQNVVEQYGKLAKEQGNPENLGAWFKQHRQAIEGAAKSQPVRAGGVRDHSGRIRTRPSGAGGARRIKPMARSQRHPARRLFRAWEASCAELQASKNLPNRLRELLALSSILASRINQSPRSGLGERQPAVARGP